MANLAKYKPNQLLAIELYSSDPGISQKAIANKCGVDVKTVRNWLSNPDFIDSIYKRYMEISGLELPGVIKAMIEEAKMGNVQAGRLILEHFGKLENKIKIQVESPFEKFLRSDAEDASYVDLSSSEVNYFDELSNKVGVSNVELPERDNSNDKPIAKASLDGKKLKAATKFAIQKEKKRQYQQQAYQLRKRAKAVDLELLPNGRHSKGVREKWMKELEKRENDLL